MAPVFIPIPTPSSFVADYFLCAHKLNTFSSLQWCMVTIKVSSSPRAQETGGLRSHAESVQGVITQGSGDCVTHLKLIDVLISFLLDHYTEQPKQYCSWK